MRYSVATKLHFGAATNIHNNNCVSEQRETESNDRGTERQRQRDTERGSDGRGTSVATELHLRATRNVNNNKCVSTYREREIGR